MHICRSLMLFWLTCSLALLVPIQKAQARADVQLSRSAQRQRKTLVIYVDRLDAATPRLEGLWLVISGDDAARLSLIPLYPVYVSSSRRSNVDLAQAFCLTAQLALAPSFLEALRSANLNWDHSVLIDQAGLTDVVDMLGPVDIGYGPLNGARTLSRLPAPGLNPPAALLAQVSLVGALCARAGGLFAARDPASFYRTLNNHFRADFPPELILNAWRQFRRLPNGQIACQFPSLQN